jgi:lactoylglutathione lyase
MTDGVNKVTALGFTKLVVEDLDKVAAFYGAVCGLIEEGRADEKIAGRPIRELYFKSDPPGTGTFTLTKFLDVQRPATESLILGFIADDIDEFVEKAIAAGGEVMAAVQPQPDHGVKVAFLKDVEGNWIEVVELL